MGETRMAGMARRPSIFDETVRRAAIRALLPKLRKWNPDNDAVGEEQLQALIGTNLDGFSIAKHLEIVYLWEPDSDMVAVLSGFHGELRAAVWEEQRRWVKHNGISVPFKVGDPVVVLGGTLPGKDDPVNGLIRCIDAPVAIVWVCCLSLGHVWSQTEEQIKARVPIAVIVGVEDVEAGPREMGYGDSPKMKSTDSLQLIEEDLRNVYHDSSVRYRGWRFFPPFFCMGCGVAVSREQWIFSRSCGPCDLQNSKTARLFVEKCFSGKRERLRRGSQEGDIPEDWFIDAALYENYPPLTLEERKRQARRVLKERRG